MLTYSTVSYCMKGGKPVNTRISITSQDEKLVNMQLKDQWDKIDWKEVEKHVNRLQARIAKAVKNGIWHLIKRLQYMLTHSFYAKLLAIRKVNQNRGKRTAGIDGEIWSSPQSKMKAALSLTDKKYVAKPLKRVFIEKPGKKKKRPLGIPTMYDRSMQSLYAMALEPIAEIKGDRTSFGFRKFRSTHDACDYAFHYLCRKNSPVWVLEGDIKGCFDNISHHWLLDNIPIDKSILKQFLKAGYIFNRQLFPTEAGTPQGGIISPILANMALDGISNTLVEKYRIKNGKTIKNGKAWKQEALIDALNPIITGWANYHQPVVSSEIFHKLDSRIWGMLWHWAKRRHPEKSKHWTADKYWHSVGKNNWVFSEENKQLKFLSDTKIVRHIRLKLDMNPHFDKDYFISRKWKLRVRKLTGMPSKIWDKTKNTCKPENMTMTNNCCPI